MKFTLRLPDNEAAIIERYCKLTGRTKTDVLREYVRTLADKSWLLETMAISEAYTVEEDDELLDEAEIDPDMIHSIATN
jgi:hypothetical protein